MEFDDILNECLERILRGETVDECLSLFPEHGDKLRPLLDTGFQVKKAALVQPRPEFRADARLQFQAAVNASPGKTKSSFFDWLRQPQWAALTAAAFLFVLGSTTAVLANNSMPDQPLYPIKLAMERIQISVTTSAAGRGELYARLLERRLDEITKMAEENKPDKIELLTGQLGSFVAEISAYDAARTESNTLKKAVPQETQVAQPAAPPVPPISPPTAATPPPGGAAGITVAEANATTPVTAAGNANAPAAADRFLPTVPMLQQSAANLARLRVLLDSAPESQRPALRDAIAAAERTYTALLTYLTNN